MLKRIVREPALVIGVLTAAFGIATAFGLDLSRDQTAAVVVFAGALMALVRFLTTPAAEVVAQVKPNGVEVAGKASILEPGTPLASIGLTPIEDPPVAPEHRAEGGLL